MDPSVARPADAAIPDLLARQVARHGHRPLLTAYDDHTGGRVELSYATAGNWAAKSANLLAEELAVAPGDVVGIDVDGHWTAAVLALGCWLAGAAVAEDPGPDARVVCVHESAGAGIGDRPTIVVGDGLRAEPVGDVPIADGVVLLGEDVHRFADDHHDDAVGAGTPALAGAGGAVSQRALLGRAQGWQALLGTAPRVGLAAPLDRREALTLLLGVVVAGGSLVTQRPAPSAAPTRRWRDERVTVAVGDATATGAQPDHPVVAFTALPVGTAGPQT